MSQGCASIRMSVTFNPYPTNRVLSADTGGKCVMLCEDAGCRGKCVKLHPGCSSPTECCPDHGDLSSCDFNDRASSARECTMQETTNIPLTTVSMPRTVTHVVTTASADRTSSIASTLTKRPRVTKPTTIRPSSTSKAEPEETSTMGATVDHLHYYRSLTSKTLCSNLLRLTHARFSLPHRCRGGLRRYFMPSTCVLRFHSCAAKHVGFLIGTFILQDL